MRASVLFLFIAAASQGGFEAVFQQGLDLAQAGKDLEALGLFREAHRLAPEEAAVLYNMGRLLERLGRREQAIDAFREAAARSPEESSIQLALGEALYRAGRTGESIAPLAIAAGGSTPPREALELLAAAYEAEGEFEKSIETLERCLSLAPDDLELRLLLGEQLTVRKRYPEAIAIWKGGLSGGGGPVGELQYRIGNVLSRAPSTATEAESSFRLALEAEPSHLRARLALARLLTRAGRFEESLAVLAVASEGGPDSSELSFALANLYQQLGQVEKAEAARARFQAQSAEAERREHQEARVHVTYKRARELLDAGKLLEAKKEFAAVIELDPANALSRSMLAKIAFSMGEIAEARGWIREALSKDPSEGEFHYLDALFAARAGDEDEAERAVRRSLQLLPGFTDAWLLLGVLLTDAGRVEEGIDSFRNAETLEPANPTVHLNLAAAYEKGGKSEMSGAALARYRELTAGKSQKR